MTDQEINVLIAEACGWVKTFEDEWGPLRGFKDETNRVYEVPNYCADLNAMHEAEKTLTVEQQADYRDQLAKLCTALWLKDRTNPFPVFATAHQRAEAFLRTLGKWQDTPQPATAHATV